MADTRTAQQRSKIMSSVKSKDTGPELRVRKALHKMGFRYRLHRSDLPGKPDIVFPTRRKVIFVHGCFWHGHGCKFGKSPKSRLNYWLPKLEKNKERDKKNLESLALNGWETIVVWQCETKNMESLKIKLFKFLNKGPA